MENNDKQVSAEPKKFDIYAVAKGSVNAFLGRIISTKEGQIEEIVVGLGTTVIPFILTAPDQVTPRILIVQFPLGEVEAQYAFEAVRKMYPEFTRVNISLTKRTIHLS